MSVPPPSWVPNSTSTGSLSWPVRSATEVSKATTEVRSDRIEANTAPNTPAYTTEDAIEPLWSRQTTVSPRTRGGRVHRAALAQAEDAGGAPPLLLPGIPPQPLGHDGPVLRQVVPQVG